MELYDQLWNSSGVFSNSLNDARELPRKMKSLSIWSMHSQRFGGQEFQTEGRSSVKAVSRPERWGGEKRAAVDEKLETYTWKGREAGSMGAVF